MSASTINSFSGRAASLERRRALSQGKSALPPATERVRTGDRSAALPQVGSGRAASPGPAAAASAAPAPLGPSPAPAHAVAGQSGRSLSMMRRRQLAGGKRTLGTGAGAPPAAALEPSSAATPPESESPPAATGSNGGGSGREQARRRRALLSQRGRGDGAAPPPTRPPRQGSLQYAPKVTESQTHGGQIVTGSRIGRGTQVTGDESGVNLPVSGTQYIGASDGAPVRSGGPKVGWARTAGGGVVSGTLIRSKVRVTGDEPGGTRITGEAEQSAEDDLTPRAAESAPVAAQFNRQANPHGHSVFGTNLGKSATSFGSRERTLEASIESTESGLAITGSAVGRGGRVTGDHQGACRQVTGNQYLTPGRAECGGARGSTTPGAQGGALRHDPVTGAKVSVAQTWGQQRLTGTNVEHDPRVTGEAAGSCAIITGSSYQGATTVHGWCDPSAAAAAEERLTLRPSSSSITGDVPRHTDVVTGTGRGAARNVTGSPYYGQQVPVSAASDAISELDARFSVTSPQRSAQLRARAAQETPSAGEAESANAVSVISTSPQITGSFAIARDRVTGNAEFHFKSRSATDPNAAAARLRLTGEGRAQGTRVTGGAWSEQSNVTGTEGSIAAERNPSERSGKPQAFSGARRFKTLAKAEDSKQLVTGLLGWSGKTAAKVTLSGGAQA